MVNSFLLLLLPISLQFLLSHPIIALSDDEPIPVGESLPTDANATAAKTLMPPEPTDQMPVSTAYFNQKTYSIQEFHELVAGLNADIKNGFKKAEEENGRLSEVISRLDGRMDKLEGWLGWKWLDRTGLANWPCLVLTGMAVLLLAVALLVLCNTLLIKRVLGGAAAAASAAAVNSTSARREKATAKKDKEMVGLVQKETV